MSEACCDTYKRVIKRVRGNSMKYHELYVWPLKYHELYVWLIETPRTLWLVHMCHNMPRSLKYHELYVWLIEIPQSLCMTDWNTTNSMYDSLKYHELCDSFACVTTCLAHWNTTNSLQHTTTHSTHCCSYERGMLWHTWTRHVTHRVCGISMTEFVIFKFVMFR